jgi:predicted phage tail protein
VVRVGWRLQIRSAGHNLATTCTSIEQIIPRSAGGMAVDHGPVMAGIGSLALLFDVLGAVVIIGGSIITS